MKNNGHDFKSLLVSESARVQHPVWSESAQASARSEHPIWSEDKKAIDFRGNEAWSAARASGAGAHPCEAGGACACGAKLAGCAPAAPSSQGLRGVAANYVSAETAVNSELHDFLQTRTVNSERGDGTTVITGYRIDALDTADPNRTLRLPTGTYFDGSLGPSSEFTQATTASLGATVATVGLSAWAASFAWKSPAEKALEQINIFGPTCWILSDEFDALRTSLRDEWLAKLFQPCTRLLNGTAPLSDNALGLLAYVIEHCNLELDCPCPKDQLGNTEKLFCESMCILQKIQEAINPLFFNFAAGMSFPAAGCVLNAIKDYLKSFSSSWQSAILQEIQSWSEGDGSDNGQCSYVLMQPFLTQDMFIKINPLKIQADLGLSNSYQPAALTLTQVKYDRMRLLLAIAILAGCEWAVGKGSGPKLGVVYKTGATNPIPQMPAASLCKWAKHELMEQMSFLNANDQSEIIKFFSKTGAPCPFF